MKEIKLTQGKVALVDDDMFGYLSQWKWHCRKDETTSYAARGEYKNKKCTTISMHRQILGLADPKTEVDHIDHNGLNNQKSNLRIVTRSQNCSNTVSHKNSSSKYLGVNWYKPTKKWRARIQQDHTPKSLGLFDNETDAARAYNEAAIKLHGEFASLNKITA